METINVKALRKIIKMNVALAESSNNVISQYNAGTYTGLLPLELALDSFETAINVIIGLNKVISKIENKRNGRSRETEGAK